MDKPPELPVQTVTWAKRIKRFLIHFLISCVILLSIEVVVGLYITSTRWKLYLTPEQMQKNAALVNDEKRVLPEKFHEIYSLGHPRHLTASMTEQIFLNYLYKFVFGHASFDSKPHCFCDMVYDLQHRELPDLKAIQWKGRLEEIEYGYGIEKYSTPEKCFNYVVYKRREDLQRTLDPDVYGHVLNKDISSLTDDETIELVILLKSQQINRDKTPQLFDSLFVDYKQKLKQSKENN
jgi:hypothetical protein